MEFIFEWCRALWWRGGPGGDLLFHLLLRQYHRRGGFSRPSSGWDRVFCPSLWPPGPVQAPGEQPGFPGARALATERSELCGCLPAFGASAMRLSRRRTPGSSPGGVPPGGGFAAPWPPAFAGVQFDRRLGFAKSGLMALAAGCGGGGAFERLVPVGCAGCPASTSGLSTWWSTTALDETWF